MKKKWVTVLALVLAAVTVLSLVAGGIATLLG